MEINQKKVGNFEEIWKHGKNCKFEKEIVNLGEKMQIWKKKNLEIRNIWQFGNCKKMEIWEKIGYLEKIEI